MLCPLSFAHAEPLKVSLLLGDANSKTTLEAVKAIYNEYPDLKEKTAFHVYPLKGIREKGLAYMKESNLVFISIMGRDLVEAVKPELEDAIKRGGKVYCVGGGSYDDDHKKMGIMVDNKMVEYYTEGGTENIKNMLLYALKKEFSFDVSCGDVVKSPAFGIYEHNTKKVFEDFEEYKNIYLPYQKEKGLTGEALSPPRTEDKPWIGIVFYKNATIAGQTKVLDAVIEGLEAAGFNVLPVYGWPSEAAIEKFFLIPPWGD